MCEHANLCVECYHCHTMGSREGVHQAARGNVKDKEVTDDYLGDIQQASFLVDVCTIICKAAW